MSPQIDIEIVVFSAIGFLIAISLIIVGIYFFSKRNFINLLKSLQFKSFIRNGTPPQIADVLKDIIENKVVCDIGCGDGDLLVAFKKHAKDVIGVEEVGLLAKAARSRGLNVISDNFFFTPIPKANIYYSWTRDSMAVYLRMKHEGVKGTFVFGHTVMPPLLKFIDGLKKEVREYNGWKVYICKL